MCGVRLSRQLCCSVREGINIFLAGFVPTENLRFREESLTFKVPLYVPRHHPLAPLPAGATFCIVPLLQLHGRMLACFAGISL